MDYIKELNRSIEKIERPKFEEKFPNIFIFGVPRSGTTLLSQVLIHCLDVGYINNLIARFYKAPFIGAILSKELKIERKVSFSSSLGRTSLISDPHEFGYFWIDVLGLKHNNSRDISVEDFQIKTANLNKLQKEILALNYVLQKPFIFKNILTGLFIREISSVLEKSIFIYIERDVFDNAVSLLKARETFYKNRKKWLSLKPREWSELKEKSPEEQVVAQVFYLRKEFEEKMRDASNVIKMKYNELAESPMEIVKKIVDFVFEATGYNINIINQVGPFEVKKYNPEEFVMLGKMINSYFPKYFEPAC